MTDDRRPKWRRLWRGWWSVRDIVSLGCLWIAWRNDSPILAIPALLQLLAYLVEGVNRATEKKEHARVAAIIAECFKTGLVAAPEFSLRIIGSAPSVTLFLTPRDAMQAESDGTFSKIGERIQTLYKMPVALDIGSR